MRRVWMSLGLLPLLLAASACPRPSRCARTDVPDGGAPPRCVALVCPPSSTPTDDGTCVCGGGASALFGGCVTPAQGERYCGPSSRFENGTCVMRTCETGLELDRASGVCLPTGSVRQLATHAMGIPLYEDETIACAEGEALVLRDSQAYCLKTEDACPRGTLLLAGACAPTRACGAGEVYDESSLRCVRVVTPFDGSHVVDVGTWTRLALGADGGPGTHALCAALREDPHAFVSVNGSSASARIGVELRFPANDVTEVRATITVTDARTGALFAGTPAMVVERAVTDEVEALRAMGGLSRAAAVSANVRCDLQVMPRPVAQQKRPADAGVESGPDARPGKS